MHDLKCFKSRPWVHDFAYRLLYSSVRMNPSEHLTNPGTTLLNPGSNPGTTCSKKSARLANCQKPCNRNQADIPWSVYTSQTLSLPPSLKARPSPMRYRSQAAAQRDWKGPRLIVVAKFVTLVSNAPSQTTVSSSKRVRVRKPSQTRT